MIQVSCAVFANDIACFAVETRLPGCFSRRTGHDNLRLAEIGFQLKLSLTHFQQFLWLFELIVFRFYRWKPLSLALFILFGQSIPCFSLSCSLGIFLLVPSSTEISVALNERRTITMACRVMDRLSIHTHGSAWSICTTHFTSLKQREKVGVYSQSF